MAWVGGPHPIHGDDERMIATTARELVAAEVWVDNGEAATEFGGWRGGDARVACDVVSPVVRAARSGMAPVKQKGPP
ncbi:hypothetical protein E2562_039133 [Oryza meyeriana var. granulata]|uniref:Uncharacterized protein n=1 Tax=Oryza meyeriana var. granulata TaxID=110450 RepID=A0A6G1CXW7_9ORYZ|nr:hypothetical protein E2562_039133 [Oryza meyeriana var. granulata]